MNTGNLRISRMVFGIEMLMCFGLATILFFSLFWPGAHPYVSMSGRLWAMSAHLVGPIGLIITIRLIVLESTSMSRITMALLCIPAVWTFIGNSIFVLNISHPGYEWRDLILLAILPVLGTAHLVYMARPKRKILTAV